MAKLDKSTFAGIAISICGIGAGLILEGGHLAQVLQPSSAFIVLGGTIGAVMMQFSWPVIADAVLSLQFVFVDTERQSDALVQNILQYAYQARKQGMLSLDAELDRIGDRFLKESLMLAIDGVSAPELRKLMELQIEYRAEQQERIPEVFEAAGGFAPTIGIIGAVIGLIQVMQHLHDMNDVGHGIAVAFVATLYGVGTANLIWIPWASKLRTRIRERQVLQEMTLEAVLSISQGVNPRTLELQMASFLPRATQSVDRAPA